MAQQKVENALAVDAEYIISTDASCLLQLQSYIDKTTCRLKLFTLPMFWQADGENI